MPTATATTLTGISIGDPSAGTGYVTAVFSVTDGTLTLSTSVTGGVSSVTGNGSSLISVTAPLSQINTTLANSSGLQYTGAAGFAGDDTLAITVNNTTTGLQGSGSMDIPVGNPVFAFTENDFYGYGNSTAGDVTITVYREDSYPGSATVDYTALGGGSYSLSTSGTLTLSSSSAVATLTLSLSTAVMSEEDFFLSLGTPSNSGSIDPNYKIATVYVLPSTNWPVAQAGSFDISEDQSLSGGSDQDQPALLDSDFDLAKDALTISDINGSTVTSGSPTTLTSGAELTVYADGSFNYVPRAGFTGTDTFDYTLATSGATALVSIEVDPLGPMVNVPAAQLVEANGTVAIDPISITDPDAGSNDIVVTLSVANGTLALIPTPAPP